MAKVTRNFLFAGFLILGLIPTIICILFPPTLGLLEKQTENGFNVTLNNWYNTREHPSIEIPENILASLQNKNEAVDQLFDSHFSTSIKFQTKVLNIQLKKENKATCIASLYSLKGVHTNTTYFSNSNFDILLENVAANDYYLLLNVDEKTYSKKITLTE